MAGVRQGTVRRVYRRLRARFGHAGWWPGKTAFEVCVGAILVQNTAWSNAEKALSSLRRSRRLSYRGLRGLSPAQIASLIRSAGTFNVKARRLAAFVSFLGTEYGGRTAGMVAETAPRLRHKLLAVHGIGPETADCIVLYAAGLPRFVVDAYTCRVFARLGMLRGDESYQEVQRFFMDRLPQDVELWGDYHGQIVKLAKDFCRPRPRCPGCPLGDLCRFPRRAKEDEG